jgi:hypothetical protein
VRCGAAAAARSPVPCAAGAVGWAATTSRWPPDCLHSMTAIMSVVSSQLKAVFHEKMTDTGRGGKHRLEATLRTQAIVLCCTVPHCVLVLLRIRLVQKHLVHQPRSRRSALIRNAQRRAVLPSPCSLTAASPRQWQLWTTDAADAAHPPARWWGEFSARPFWLGDLTWEVSNDGTPQLPARP